MSVYQQGYYQEHKAEYRKRNAAWVKANPEKNRQHQRKYTQANKAKISAAQSARRRSNREAILAKERVYRTGENYKAYRRSLYLKNKERSLRTSRTNRLRRDYGLTVPEYDAMLALQKGLCAICDLPCKTKSRLCVDHDHQTGAVRGLLCRRCNRTLGQLEENPILIERLLKYIQHHGLKSV